MSEILDTVVGYGIDLSLTEWKNNVNSLLYEKISRVNYGIWDRYQEFFELYGDDYDRCEEDAWDAFCDEYENDEGTDYGITAMITTMLNENYFGGTTVFQHEDQCLYVEAYIPADDSVKAFMPTQEKIRKMLATMVNPFLKEPAEVGYQVIHLG